MRIYIMRLLNWSDIQKAGSQKTGLPVFLCEPDKQTSYLYEWWSAEKDNNIFCEKKLHKKYEML